MRIVRSMPGRLVGPTPIPHKAKISVTARRRKAKGLAKYGLYRVGGVIRRKR
jgi:hypothetical protein